MVEQWNSVGGIVEQCWRNSGTETVEQCRWNNEVEQCWRSVMELWNRVGRTMEQCRWNIVVVQWTIVNKTKKWNSEKVMVEQ